MKTGQMLFVAVGGMLLGAAGTLALQTGLVHYEVTLDIRPRGAVTLPAPPLSSTAGDPYLTPSPLQTWEAPPAADGAPVTLPPLNEQQIAEIVALREQFGHPISPKADDDRACPDGCEQKSFEDHVRTAAGIGKPPDETRTSVRDIVEELSRPPSLGKPSNGPESQTEVSEQGSSLSRGLRGSVLPH